MGTKSRYFKTSFSPRNFVTRACKSTLTISISHLSIVHLTTLNDKNIIACSYTISISHLSIGHLTTLNMTKHKEKGYNNDHELKYQSEKIIIKGSEPISISGQKDIRSSLMNPNVIKRILGNPATLQKSR